MKIGIFVNNSKSIFVNGCLQQGYFLMKCFRKKGYNCSFITVDNTFSKFELINEDVHNIKSTKDLDQYNALIFSSGSVNDSSYLSYCKMKGISVTSLCVGNYYIINQEELVFDVHKDNNVLSRMYSMYIDESWLMPMYTHNHNYMKFISDRPVHISPYVWDSTFIDLYIKNNSLNIDYQPTEKKLDILIMEPNLSIHKTCLVPLLIAEEFYRNYPNKLGKVYLFCKPNTSRFNELNYLKIIKLEKVEYYDRVISMSLFDNLTKLGKKFAVLSSNIRNGLNFLHLECFKLNIPIVHNCKPFIESGFYYEESDILDDYPKAVEHLNNIYEGNYTQNTESILDKYNPDNSVNIENYNKLITNLSKNNYDLLGKLKDNLTNISKINSSYSNDLAIVFIDNNTGLDIINLNIQNVINKLKIDKKYYLLTSKNYTNLDSSINIINVNDINNCYLDIYRNINHNNVIVINSNVLVEFDISKVFLSSELVGIEIIENKELHSNDYQYYTSFLKIIKKVFKNDNNVKLFNPDFCYFKNSPNISSLLINIPHLKYFDNTLVFNIINNLFYTKISNIDNKKILINSNDGYCGYIYKNTDDTKLITKYTNISAKNKCISESEKLYLCSNV